MGFPSAADLNAMPEGEFADEVAPLFEGAQGFLRLLGATRPFDSYHDLLAKAREVARTMPEADQIELLNAHPALGGDPASISAASFDEQGFGSADEAAGSLTIDELAMLNEVYEQRFGFRFVVFVAGRPLSAIPPLMEAAMRNDRPAELGRGLDEVVDIAADRLGRLRGDVLESEERP